MSGLLRAGRNKGARLFAEHNARSGIEEFVGKTTASFSANETLLLISYEHLFVVAFRPEDRHIVGSNVQIVLGHQMTKGVS